MSWAGGRGRGGGAGFVQKLPWVPNSQLNVQLDRDGDKKQRPHWPAAQRPEGGLQHTRLCDFDGVPSHMRVDMKGEDRKTSWPLLRKPCLTWTTPSPRPAPILLVVPLPFVLPRISFYKYLWAPTKFQALLGAGAVAGKAEALLSWSLVSYTQTSLCRKHRPRRVRGRHRRKAASI